MNPYQFINPIQGGATTAEGVHYLQGYSDEELEAKIETLIDPNFGVEPEAERTAEGAAAEPKSIYPPTIRGDLAAQRRFDENYLKVRRELPPLYLLPEGSLLRAEWFRRAALLKEYLEELRAHPPLPKPSKSPELRAREDRELLGHYERDRISTLEHLNPDEETREYLAGLDAAQGTNSAEIFARRLKQIEAAIAEIKQRQQDGYR